MEPEIVYGVSMQASNLWKLLLSLNQVFLQIWDGRVILISFSKLLSKHVFLPKF